MLEAGAVINNVTELERGFVLSMAVSTGASLLVLAGRGSDLALVSFEMAELINRVGHAITPDTRADLLARYWTRRWLERPGRGRPRPALAVSACTAGGPGGDSPRITVGLVASLTGAYQAVGEDTRDGFDLYLETHGHLLGGHPVDVAVVDEADGSATAIGAAKALAQRDDVLAVTGATNAETVTALLPILQARGAALISSNARPPLTDTRTIWSTSFLPDEPGRAVANYIRANVDGPVWAMASDNQSGHADLSGFVSALESAGGRLANQDQQPLYTAGTTNFLPLLSQARRVALERCTPTSPAPTPSPSCSSTPSPTPGTCRCSDRVR